MQTAFPIGFFSVMDRPFKNLSTYMRFPKVCAAFALQLRLIASATCDLQRGPGAV